MKRVIIVPVTETRQFHLAFVFRFEGSLLQIHYNQALKFTVVEEQIDMEVVSVELNAFLPRNEAEARSQFQKKGLNLPQNRFLEAALQEAIGQPKEVQDIGVPSG